MKLLMKLLATCYGCAEGWATSNGKCAVCGAKLPVS